MNKKQIIQHLGLVEHIEGGYFTETYRSNINVDTQREGKKRSVLTSIYYMLTSNRPIDRFHRNQSDILHYFQAGSAITYFILSPSGELTKTKLGLNFDGGETAQLLVPGGYWKAAVLEEGEFGLIGESVAPGFDYRDMEIATVDNFQNSFPELFSVLSPYIK